MLYVPRVGQRHSVFCGEANASGPAYLCNLERPLPAGGEFVEPRSVQDPSEDEVASPELPTVHELLMIAPERLVVACISDCCSPPSLVNEVHVVAPQLLQSVPTSRELGPDQMVGPWEPLQAPWVARWTDPPRSVQPLPPEYAVSQLQQRQRCGRPAR